VGIFDSFSKQIEQQSGGIKISDLLGLPDALRRLMTHIVRQRTITFEEAIEITGESAEETQQMLDRLVDGGYLQSNPQDQTYRVRYGKTNPRQVSGSVWGALEERAKK
jgi:hypothetical protein